ncbi:MAG: hypothetical protein KC736_04595 [Candidatus Moranbacteria bacterium]|nr:hypothetical protein [Candidatus Moranbacteria bacterium]
MHLEELIEIIKKEKYTYLAVMGICLGIGVVTLLIFSKVYQAELLVNVTRAGVVETQEYAYDDFYRLQADERFADTIVRWIGSQRILNDSISVARKNDPALEWIRKVKARRVSSQAIIITYTSSSQKGAQEFAKTLVVTINKQITDLNKEGREEGWFILQSNSPTIQKGAENPVSILASALAGGVFVGFWVVLIKEAFPKKRKR